MFFIDNDQPEVPEGKEQRRARAHHHLRAALAYHLPGAAPLGHGDTRMPFRRLGTEPRLDTRDELGCQRDLGQQDQRLAPPLQGFSHRFQINLGLARTGHAAQQCGAVIATANGIAQHLSGIGLILGQRFSAAVRIKPGKRKIARAILFQHGALPDQPLDHRRRDTRLLRQFPQCEGQPAVVLKHCQHPFARIRHPRRHHAPVPIDLLHRRRVGQARRTGGQTQHGRHGRQRVIGGAAKKVLHFGPHRRNIQHADHLTDLGDVEIPASRAPDDPEHLARPQRYLDKGPGMASALGRAVIQQTVQRLRRQHRHQLILNEKVLAG